MTGGGLRAQAPAGTPSADRWIRARPNHLFPVRVLGRLFRGKFLAALAREYARGHLDLSSSLAELQDPRAFARLKRRLYRLDWVVYAKRPFAGPGQVFRYLGRYTHRTGLANHRLLAIDDAAVFRQLNVLWLRRLRSAGATVFGADDIMRLATNRSVQRQGGLGGA